MRNRLIFFALSALSLSVACGCSGDGRQAVSGTVTLKGKMLDQGSIEFKPVSSTLNSFAHAEIKDGKYSIPASKGLLAGEYKVSVSSSDPNAGADDELPGESDKLVKDRIPEEYNINTKLTCTIKEGESTVYDVKIP